MPFSIQRSAAGACHALNVTEIPCYARRENRGAHPVAESAVKAHNPATKNQIPFLVGVLSKPDSSPAHLNEFFAVQKFVDESNAGAHGINRSGIGVAFSRDFGIGLKRAIIPVNAGLLDPYRALGRTIKCRR